MKNLPLSIQSVIRYCLVLLLGLFFVPNLQLARAEVSLQVLTVDGLVFETFPEFGHIEFFSSDEVETIQIEVQSYDEVKLENFSFEQTEVLLDMNSESVTTHDELVSSTPSPSPSPMMSPTPTAIPTASITHTPTPTSIPTTVPTQTPTPTPEVKSAAIVGDEIWDTIAKCESGNNWSIDTGNGYFGGLQFSQSAWESVGGSGNPAHASREEQIEKGKKLQEKRGWGVWGDCAKKLGLT